MLTVLLATRNRASILGSVLGAFATLREPTGGWKVVIVDNGSDDHTKEVVSSFKSQIPLTYVFEPRGGKNHALNTGLCEIEGDLVVLTDDDVYPHENWLEEFRSVADRSRGFTIFGGVILPRWEVSPESWILEWVPLAPCFTLTSPQLHEGPTTPDHIFGPNMAIRRCVFDAGNRFNVSIGPNGKHYAMGSETELVRRLVNSGYRAYHCKSAVVEHLIQKSQMQEPWIFARAIRFGRGQYTLARPTISNYPSVYKIPRYMIRQMLVNGLEYARACVLNDHEKMFRARWAMSFVYGQMIEARSGSMNGPMQAKEML